MFFIIFAVLFFIFNYPELTSENLVSSTAVMNTTSPALKIGKGRRVNTPFSVEEELEKQMLTNGENCLRLFQEKGGTLYHLNPFFEEERLFALQPGDIVYPSCSAGYCRSQTLWYKLSHYRDVIHLFPPHATRSGCDPFNQSINWNKNAIQETKLDEFELWAGVPKAVRVGFDQLPTWKKLEQNPTVENLQVITDYYNKHYFGPTSTGDKSGRRVYITFVANAHVILHRLNSTNDRLDNVVVVYIDCDDWISNAHKIFDTYPRSKVAYEEFAKLLDKVIDTSKLSNTK